MRTRRRLAIRGVLVAGLLTCIATSAPPTHEVSDQIAVDLRPGEHRVVTVRFSRAAVPSDILSVDFGVSLPGEGSSVARAQVQLRRPGTVPVALGLARRQGSQDDPATISPDPYEECIRYEASNPPEVDDLDAGVDYDAGVGPDAGMTRDAGAGQQDAGMVPVAQRWHYDARCIRAVMSMEATPDALPDPDPDLQTRAFFDVKEHCLAREACLLTFDVAFTDAVPPSSLLTLTVRAAARRSDGGGFVCASERPYPADARVDVGAP